MDSLNDFPDLYIPKLSRGAKDLWVYLMHYPDRCQISMDSLYKLYDPQISCRVTDKKYIENSLDELVYHDYIQRERICD